jgi:mRNA interferase RelE/StbE
VTCDLITVKTTTFTPAALKGLTALPKEARMQILAKVKRYAETGAGDVRALVGRPGARLRIGRYRAVFIEEADSLRVLAVGDRRDIYE